MKRVMSTMCPRGFTLIELLVVMAILGLLLSYIAPRYFGAVTRAEEAALRQNLFQMRDAIDKFYGDRLRYPNDLNELVSSHYLRSIPPDPITKRANTWVVIAPKTNASGKVADVRSGAPGRSNEGSDYATW